MYGCIVDKSSLHLFMPLQIVPYLYTKVGGDTSYRVLAVFADQSVHMLQQAGRH